MTKAIAKMYLFFNFLEAYVWLPPSGRGFGDLAWDCAQLVFMSSQSRLKEASSQGQPQSKAAAYRAWHNSVVTTWQCAGTTAKIPSSHPPPSLWLPCAHLLPSAHENAASAKILLPSALVEAHLSVCLSLSAHAYSLLCAHTHTHKHKHIFLHSKLIHCALHHFPPVPTASQTQIHCQSEMPTILAMKLLFLTAQYKHRVLA